MGRKRKQFDKPVKLPHIDRIYDVYGQSSSYFTKEQGRKEIEKYWDVFVVDALLGNFDRHGNNWGYLVNNENPSEIIHAPIYDCGSCLYPQLKDEALEEILQDKEEIQKRIDTFPTAALMVDGQKVAYSQFISSFANQDCTDALLRIVPKIDMEKIREIVDSTPGISDIRKEFYKTMLEERYEQILLEPYREVCKALSETEEADKEERE